MLGFIVPAILPGAHAWHKGYNLYNGGLAFGLFGFFLFNFFYNTMGIDPSSKLTRFNPVYEQFGHSFQLYANCFFLILFAICSATGYYLNGKSFKGYGELIRDTGHQSDFAAKYSMPVCLINIGLVGTCFLLYLDVIMVYTEGVGFTGCHHRRSAGCHDLHLHGTAPWKHPGRPGRIPAALLRHHVSLPHQRP